MSRPQLPPDLRAVDYEPRWPLPPEADYGILGPHSELPWVRALSEAVYDAQYVAWSAVVQAHVDEFRRAFDAEMDRKHAELVETYSSQIDRFRDDPNVWLVPPSERQ